MDIVVFIDIYIVHILIQPDAELYSTSEICLTKKTPDLRPV